MSDSSYGNAYLKQHYDKNEHYRVMVDCFSKLWDHSVDLMFIMAIEEDGEFSLYDNNPASRSVMGLDASDPVHRRSIRDIWDEETVETFFALYRKAIKAKHPISCEQVISPAGQLIFFDTLFVPIFDEQDEPLFVCGVSREVTKIKEAEQIALSAQKKLQEYSSALENINTSLDAKVKSRTHQLEQASNDLKSALDAKSNFVARMSHEIRTPLNAMIGLCNLLKKTPLNDAQQDYVDKIADSGEVLQSLVNDVLDFSKIEANKLQPEQIEFCPEKVMLQAFNLSQVKAQQKGLELLFLIDTQLPETLIGDPLRIQQIAINLLGNAVKFTDSGTVTLEVGSQKTLGADIEFYFEVKDTGIGISQQQVRALFNSFVQADSSITRRYGGTGLGLSICEKLCELMGGQIEVSSELDKGSVFRVTLPVKSAEKGRLTDKYRAKEGCHVLVVDDLSACRRALSKMLIGLGYQVTLAKSGFEALDCVQDAKEKTLHFDAVLMDWQMPEMDGVETSERIHQLLKVNCPPIFLISGCEQHVIQQHIDSGLVCRYLRKPLIPSVLFQALSGELNGLDEEAAAAATAQTQLDLSAYRLLLVEDNPINHQVVEGYLEESGITIEWARDGEEALQLLSEQAFDVVLMDIQMPRLDGLSATRFIRQTMQLTMPIIAISAHVSEATIADCHNAGMNGHIGKPLDELTLYRTLAECLGIASAGSNGDSHGSKQYDASLLAQIRALEQLDVDEALARLNKKPGLFLSLVKAFYQRYVNEELLDSGLDLTELADEAHSLKSNTAYIGALSLSTQLAVLEQQLRSGKASDQLAELKLQLNHLLAQLATVFEGRSAINVKQPSELLDIMKRLQRQLYQSEFAAEDTLKIVVMQLEERLSYQRALSVVATYLDELEYEKAYVIVTQLVEQLEEEQDG
ncbi:response regulator [Aliagarivorans marinus]|uniref:response regulator n=1 Tax=Aliagarivorans marinus TaxID=561965 RepID=UPI0003F8B3EB|nr:response regulator [Aliagarivorans marinus]